MFDIAATGDVNIGQSTRETGQDLTTITELLKPSKIHVNLMNKIEHDMITLLVYCDLPCVHGACVDNNTCFCSEGYEGVMCNDTSKSIEI